MRLAAIGFFIVSLCRAADLAQQPTVEVTPEKASQRKDDDQADPRDNRQTPLTPEEELQRQIHLFDPKYRPDQDANGSSAGRDLRVKPQQAPSAADLTPTSGPVVVSPDEKPLPGSLAASREAEASPFGPKVAEDGGGSAYSGPSVLSHSYTLNSLDLPRDEKWTESFSVGEIYDSGPARPMPDATGVLQSSASNGFSASWTLGGQRVTKRDQVSFLYSGNMSRYQSNQSNSGTNQTLTASWTHMVSRHLTFSSVATASKLSASYALQNPTAAAGSSLANLNVALSPVVQPTDAGAKQIDIQSSGQWQQSARLSFTFGGGYFGIERNGPGLVGATGRQEQGGVNYRYSRRVTVGVYYSNSHMLFPHGLGASDTSSEGVNYSIALGKSLQIKMSGGISTTESIAETPVPVLPIVAALLGVQSGLIDYYHGTSAGEFSGQLLKDFGRRGTVFAAYNKGVSPGNGILLTSSEESYSAGLTRKLFRKYTLQVTASKQSLTSIAQTMTSRYQATGAQISLSRNYRGGIGLQTMVIYRYLGKSNPAYEPNEVNFSSAISWSPHHPKLWPPI